MSGIFKFLAEEVFQDTVDWLLGDYLRIIIVGFFFVVFFVNMCRALHEASMSQEEWDKKNGNDPKNEKSGPGWVVAFIFLTVASGAALCYEIDKVNDARPVRVHANFALTETPSPKAIETSRDESSIELPTAPQSLGEHWIKDNDTDVYLWNPEPYGDERISWSGSYVQDGDYKFAEGNGTVTWYRDGQVIQVDEGFFEHGKHHGRFKHTLESGNVVYSNWEHGEEVVDTPAPRENTDAKGQYVGTYNSGMKAFIVPGTLKVSSDRNSCNVKILAEGDAGDISYLDYRIWREGRTLKFSNSEGYSGVITSTMRVENKIWEIAQNQF